MWLTIMVNRIYFFVNEYNSGVCLGVGDLDFGC